MDYRKLNHVLAEINAYTGAKKQVGDSTFVLCPYHNERTPSGRIFHSPNSKSPGFFKCYGCGQNAKFDEVAVRLGMRPYTYASPQELDARPAVRELEVANDIKYQHTPLPKNKLWRHIKTNLLIDIGCTLIEQYREKFIYMPVKVKGTEKGFIRARLKKAKDKPSYLNKAGKWSENFGLFPYDYSVKMMSDLGLDTLVLVEGPRDALRLLSEGIPAIAILGTQSWSKRKGITIELSGAHRVIICGDGDCAGIAANKMIKEKLEGLVATEIFDLCGKDSPYWQFRKKDSPTKSAKAKGVDLWDPASMPKAKVQQLRKLLKGSTVSG